MQTDLNPCNLCCVHSILYFPINLLCCIYLIGARAWPKIAPTSIPLRSPIPSLSAALPWSPRGDEQGPTLHAMDRDSFCVSLVLVCLAAAPVARTAAVLGSAGNESSNATHHVGHAGVPWETCDFETEYYPYMWLVVYIYLTLLLFVGEPALRGLHALRGKRNTLAPPLPSRLTTCASLVRACTSFSHSCPCSTPGQLVPPVPGTWHTHWPSSCPSLSLSLSPSLSHHVLILQGWPSYVTTSLCPLWKLSLRSWTCQRMLQGQPLWQRVHLLQSCSPL